MRGLYLHAGDNKLFASSPDGGLWVCDVRLANLANPAWSPISDHLDNIEVRAFGVAPSNSNIIYLANKSFSMYRTSNGGTSWTRLTSLDKGFGRVNRILVRHDAPNWIYVGTTTGLYQSADGGATWFPRRFEGEDVLDIAMDSDDSRVVYVGVRNKGIFKTLNRGTTWENIRLWQPSSTVNCRNPLDVRTSPSGIIKIALGERKANGTDETPQTRTVAVKFGKGVWISTNGEPFQERSGTCGGATCREQICADGAGSSFRSEDLIRDEWANAIAIDPFNSDHILVGQAALFETSDGGSTWTKRDDRQRHEDIQEIQFHRTSRNTVFLANDGGVEGSTANSLNFSTMYTNLITAQLMRVGIRGDVAVGNSDHNGIIGTRALSGGNWERATPPNTKLTENGPTVCGYGGNGMESMGVYADPKQDPNREGRFYIFHTNDPWHLVRLVYPNEFLGQALPADLLTWGNTNCPQWAASFGNFAPVPNSRIPERPQQGIAVDERTGSQVILACASASGNNGGDNLAPFKLMLTRNGGAKPDRRFDPNDDASLNTGPVWQTALSSPDDPFVSVAFSPRRTGMAYAISKSGALSHASFPQLRPNDPPLLPWIWTRENGWPTANQTGGVLHFAIHPTNDRKVFAITANTFARTSDLGQNWDPIMRRNTPTGDYYSIVASGQRLFLGVSDGVYVSTNEGDSWTKVNGNLPNVKVVQLLLQVEAGNSYLYAVTFGRGLWRIPLSQL